MWSESDGHSTTAALSLVRETVKTMLDMSETLLQNTSAVQNINIAFHSVLGEEAFSYGYGGTGKKSSDCKFADFGEKFGENDVIGCYIVSNEITLSSFKRIT